MGDRLEEAATGRLLRRDERGFTLLELTLVVVIIAILIAVLTPTIAGARSTAQDHAAMSDLRTGLVAANTVFTTTEDGSFKDMTISDLATAEPSLRWSDSQVTTGPGTLAAYVHNVQISETGAYAIGLAAQAGDGTCWFAIETDTDAPWYGSGPVGADGKCDASDAGTHMSSRTL